MSLPLSSAALLSVKRLVRLAALTSLLLTASGAAGLGELSAQETSPQTLSDRLSRLQREVSDLQRQAAIGGAAPAAATVGAGAASVTPLRGDQVGRLELRLSRQEDQLRGVTGQMEEMNYRLQQLTLRLDGLVRDLDQRRAAGQAPVAAAEQPLDQTPVGDPSTTAAAGLEGDGSPKVLGYISKPTAAPINSAPIASQPLTESTSVAPPAATPQATTPQATTSPEMAAVANPPSIDPEAAYQQAFSALRQANWSKAEAELTGFLRDFPNHNLAGNAQYWLGETYYVRGDFGTAATVFAEGFEKYPKGGKAPDNLLKLGMALSHLERRQDACDTFLALQQRYPDAPASLLDRSKRERTNLGC